MLIHVTTDNHIQGRERLVRETESMIETSLSRYAPQVMRVEVHLADENSHKQGENDKRCTLEARLAGLQPVAASANGSSVDQALDAALDKLAALLEHKLGRLSERKGRTPYSGEESE
jgi:ribosome-associated translation inhibitor RaiA